MATATAIAEASEEEEEVEETEECKFAVAGNGKGGKLPELLLLVNPVDIEGAKKEEMLLPKKLHLYII